MAAAQPELVDALDEGLRPVGKVPRSEAHAKGLLHRCVHVLVFDPSGRLWLQKRSLDQRLWPGLWTSSASGHVGAGEPEDEAAARELKEEMGLDLPMKRVGEFRFADHEENEVAGLWEARTPAPPKPGPEVLAVMAVRREELAALRQRLPDRFAPTFAAALEAYGWR